MSINCVPLLVDLFLYLYEAEFIQKLPHENTFLVVAYSSTFRYINDVVYVYNNQFHTYVIRYILMGLKSKTPQCSTSAYYLDILLKLDTNSKLTT
jgi:hypothetical protein